MTASLADRYAGCLVGLACGDALGGPVEFQARAQIAEHFPNGVREMVGGGWLHLAPGEITDDTQMALAIAHACISEGVDIDGVAASFVAWYLSGPKDIGTTTRSALAAARAGIDEPEIVAALDRIPSLTDEELNSGGFVLATLTAAFWCLLHRASAEEAIVAAVSLGDDADTTGAVTGALSGACWGLNALPERWRAVLQHRDELVALADQFLIWSESERM